MKVGIIRLDRHIGFIPEEQIPEGIELIDIVVQVQSQPDVDKYHLLIDCPGGRIDVGRDTRRYLEKLNKPIAVYIVGMCASMASEILFVGEERYWVESPSTKLMIHNPWGGATGDADEMQKAADELRALEEEAAIFYSEKTGLPVEAFSALMRNETWITKEQALAMKFVTGVCSMSDAIPSGDVQPKQHIRAYALTKKQSEDMSLLKELKDKVDTMFKMVVKPAKSMTATTADGSQINITKADGGEGAPAVGDTITLADGGAAPDGSHILPDLGIEIKVTAGVITEVMPYTAEQTPEEKIAALELEVKTLKEKQGTDEAKALKEENENLKKEIDTYKGLSKKVEEIEAVAKLMVSKGTPPSTTQSFKKPDDKKGFTRQEMEERKKAYAKQN